MATITKTDDGYALPAHSIRGFLNKGLSPRELMKILLAAAGLSAKETSIEMNCSEATTNKRQQTINHKLHAKNSMHALSEAFRLGIIAHYILIVSIFAGSITEEQPDLIRLRPPRIQTRTSHRARQDYVL